MNKLLIICTIIKILFVIHKLMHCASLLDLTYETKSNKKILIYKYMSNDDSE